MMKRAWIAAGAAALLLTGWVRPAAGFSDTFVEDFDGRAEGSSVDGVNRFQVTTGSAGNAVVQSAQTPRGIGKSLKLSGAATPVTVKRSDDYGGLAPTWIRFAMAPGLGEERRKVPSTGIAAVSFDYTGHILATDGSSWVETGKTFSAGSWYEVAYKLDFSRHTYDLYVKPLSGSETGGLPVKVGLKFIDSSIGRLKALSFGGAYSAAQPDDAYLDDLSVSAIERVEFISPAQTLLEDQPSGPITVQLQNSLREPQRAVQDLSLELKSSSPEGRFSLQREPWKDISVVVLLEDATSATFYYKDGQEGKPVLSAKEYPDQGWLEGLQEQKVIPKSDYFEVLATSPQTAGIPFQATITARTKDGDLEEGYGGTVTVEAAYVNPSSGAAVLAPAEAVGFSKGKRELELVYPDAGVIQVEVADSADPVRTGASGQILVVPARFQVEAEERQVVGRPFPLTITALNAQEAVTANYQGPAALGVEPVGSTARVGVLSPEKIAAGGFEKGKTKAEVSYSRWGTALVKVADVSAPTVSGQSGPVTFYPAALDLRIPPPPAPRDFFYTDELFEAEVSAMGADGRVIPNYGGKVEIGASGDLALPQNYTFLQEEGGLHAFPASAAAPGTYSIQVRDASAALASPAASVTVKRAFVKVIPTVAPVDGVAEVVILIVDEKGKVIQSESSALLNVTLVEDNPNRSASSSVLNQPVKVTQGKAVVLISDSELETVTVVPSSALGLKVESGTVNFGRFGHKGFGVLLWREVTEEKPK